MLLTNEERQKFIQWLEQQIISNTQIFEQMGHHQYYEKAFKLTQIESYKEVLKTLKEQAI